PWRDFDDMRQDGLMACWRAFPHFDPTRASLPTFLGRVVANRIASVVRSSRTPVMLPLDAAEACTGGISLRQIHLEIDVARVLRRLNENDRRLASALMENDPTEASRKLGVARSTVYVGIARLRLKFAAAGFGPRNKAAR